MSSRAGSPAQTRTPALTTLQATTLQALLLGLRPVMTSPHLPALPSRPTLRAWALLVAGTHSGPFMLLSASSHACIDGGLGMAARGPMTAPPLAAVPLAYALCVFGHGLHRPGGQAGAVGPFPQRAGAACALAGGVLALLAFGVALDGTLRPLGWGLAVSACVTALIARTRVSRLDPPR